MCRSAPRYPGSRVEFEAVGVKGFLTPLSSNFDSYSRWLLVNDRVGWLRDIRSVELQRAVDKKAANLALYKQKYRSTALLLVADRTFNSGRLAMSDNLAVQNPGFRAIYFMSYPESVTCAASRSFVRPRTHTAASWVPRSRPSWSGTAYCTRI